MVAVDVLMLASTLEPGETIRELCPRCNGGSTQEKSLTITLDYDGGVVWNCFRDRCDNKGRSGGTYIPKTDTPEIKKYKRFEGETRPLSDFHLEKIRNKWGIVNPPYWYWTGEYGGRVAMSVRSPKFMHRGWVLRDLRGVARAKALTFMEPEEVQLAWYRPNKSRAAPCVVVEDIPSAVRVSMCGVNAVALLGTILNTEKASELGKYSGHVVLALDQDATSKSFSHAYRYMLHWDQCSILPLHKDFKDMTPDEAVMTLNRIQIGDLREGETCTIISNQE